MRKRNQDGLTYIEGQGYEGVVYSYRNTTENDKRYVGCTPRERTRRASWRNWSNAYGGAKIANARKESEPTDWVYTVEERLYSKNLEELEKMLEEKEAEYIKKYDAYENGYNSNYGGTGHTGVKRSELTCERISKNHRDYQTKETRKKLSDSLSGHAVKESTRRKISEGNTGKVRTEEMKKAQSERQKGIEPVAATEGAKAWVKNNGGGFWSNHELSDEAKANMKAAQQKRGIPVIAHFPDGHTEVYNTMLDASKDCNTAVGSIFNNLKHSSEQYKTKAGFWFERKEVNDGTIDTTNSIYV